VARHRATCEAGGGKSGGALAVKARTCTPHLGSCKARNRANHIHIAATNGSLCPPTCSPRLPRGPLLPAPTRYPLPRTTNGRVPRRGRGLNHCVVSSICSSAVLCTFLGRGGGGHAPNPHPSSSSFRTSLNIWEHWLIPKKYKDFSGPQWASH
jgi:hypothetical protein